MNDPTVIDVVTGARTEVSLLVDLPADRLWALVTDVPRYGEQSPECVHTAWLEPAGGGEPAPGDRFAGRNRFANGLVGTTICVVTEVARPGTFGWVVLDAGDDPDRPGSIWRYELEPVDGRTRLRHTFEHGPGDTGARTMAAASPTGLADRLARIRSNMTTSLAAMLGGVHYSEVSR
jgi:hypothetical protein